MNTRNAELLHRPAAGNILLGPEQDFLIQRVNPAAIYKEYNVTYRTPRNIGGMPVELITTTTINIGALNGLRVEALDNAFFIVGDECNHHASFRLAVMSEAIAYRLIKALLEINKPSENDRAEPTKKTVLPARLVRINDMLAEASESILTLSVVMVAVAATFWLVTH